MVLATIVTRASLPMNTLVNIELYTKDHVAVCPWILIAAVLAVVQDSDTANASSTREK